MKKSMLNNNTTKQIGFGLTAAALVVSYCVCVCAALGQGLLSVLLCCAVCFSVSLKLKNGVYSPDAFLLVPLFYIFSVLSPVSACISVLSGSFVFIGLSKILKDRKIPDAVITGATLSLAIGVTILLTNHYFGIGATGETPFEMLKSFRSLGFHPNFRGLLYGTITLFTMITFPFKFRKLNKYLPAQFITVLIPFLLNLFLNPVKELTTINEADFSSVFQSLQGIPAIIQSFSVEETPVIIKGALFFALALSGYSLSTETSKDKAFFYANACSGALCGLPLTEKPIRNYGKNSALFSLFLIVASILLFPRLFARLPTHCAGAMLIVCAWQSVPYKKLAEVFKSRNPKNIFVFALGAPLYILFEPFVATIIFVILTLFCKKTNTSSKRKECM